MEQLTGLAASARRAQQKANKCQSTFINMRMCAVKLSISQLRRMIFAAMIFTPLVTVAQNSDSSQSNSDGQYTLRMNADLVILNAVVMNSHNVLVSGLNKEDFTVYEDGVPQQINHFSHEDIPVTVGILVDNSGSMRPKLNDVIVAAMAFARSSNPQDQMFVINFNDYVSLGLPADTPFTDRSEQLLSSLLGIRGIGQTALYDGIIVGLNRLRQGSRDKKVLLLITDGGDTASKHTFAQVIGLARQSAAIIYAIGIFDELDGDQNPDVLKQLAKETGGEAFFPETSEAITAICEGIAHDIRNQYTLAYVPAIASQDGRYRAIKVKASSRGRGHLTVRTRAGYLVPLASPPASGETSNHEHNK